MPVTKSSYVLGEPANGMVLCTETHVTEYGEAVVSYLGSPDSDWRLHLNDTAAVIKARLVAMEFGQAELNDVAPVLKNQTTAQFLSRFRLKYKSASKADACRMAWWLLRRLGAGHVTEAQCRTAFGGLTVERWGVLKATRLTQQSRAWAALLAALGE